MGSSHIILQCDPHRGDILYDAEASEKNIELLNFSISAEGFQARITFQQVWCYF